MGKGGGVVTPITRTRKYSSSVSRELAVLKAGNERLPGGVSVSGRQKLRVEKNVVSHYLGVGGV